MSKPHLYGIHKSNRSGNDLWGKNQFNSTFPASLCCYMRDKGLNPVYVSVDENFETKSSDENLTFEDLFNTNENNASIKFLFESNFQPYEQYLHDKLDHTDLVININDKDVRALEVKLTVLPDSTTSSLSEERWGSELVIRPDSISYACLGIYMSLLHKKSEIRKLIEPVAIKVESWENTKDILKNSAEILATLQKFFTKYQSYQIPFLIQPIWRTNGRSPDLKDDAFDVFVWSDFAILKIAIDQALLERGDKGNVSRYLRSAARTIRALSELFVTDKIHIARIFRQMALGYQTDKEFALGGRITSSYMKHERLIKPILKKEVLKEIILGGGENLLSPERRFDATIYFTASHLFE